MPRSRIERERNGPRESAPERAATWLGRHWGKLLGLIVALPVLRHLGIFQQLSQSGYSALRTVGSAGEAVGGTIAQPFAYVGDRMHDAVFGRMENDPTRDNGVQRFYRAAERFFGSDTRNLFAPSTVQPEVITTPPRPLP